MNKFKAGDKVRCIKNVFNLKKGEVYTVRESYNESISLDIEDNKRWFFWRFELVEEPETMEIGEKYVSQISINNGFKTRFVTCVGYDKDTDRFVVKDRSGKYRSVEGKMKYSDGNTCWKEYKKPLVKSKYAYVEEDIIGVTVRDNRQATIRPANLELIFTDGVLTKANVLK